MATVTVTAIRPFEHDGRTYARGDMITATPAEAVALARLRYISLARHSAGFYNRRDLVAAPVAAVVVSEPEPAPRRRGRPRKTAPIPEAE